MVPVTLPSGEERIGTAKRTCVSIVVKALKTENVDGMSTRGIVGS